MNEPHKNDLTSSYQTLISSQQTLLLATASSNAVPDLSYAPFVRDEAGVFYVFVSELAIHTGNLRNNAQASVMFIRPEHESGNLFARERAVLNCRVSEIERNAELYAPHLQAMQEKFGEIVQLLRTLPDFHLFALHPETGRYVIGFGKAYAIHFPGDWVDEHKIKP